MSEDLEWKLKRLIETVGTYGNQVVFLRTDTRFQDEVKKRVEEIASGQKQISKTMKEWHM